MALFLPVLENVGHHELGMALPLAWDGGGERWRQHCSIQIALANPSPQSISLQAQQITLQRASIPMSLELADGKWHSELLGVVYSFISILPDMIHK